jgi:hypothetical protein
MTELAIPGLRGRLIGPSDEDYGEARALYNGMIDKRPRMIARCTCAADVMAAINHAREQKLLLAICGGGHNGPGFGSCDGGLVIDLSQMRSVRVDPATRTARVDPAARPPISIMPPTRSGSRCHSESWTAPAWRASRWVEGRLPHATARADDRQLARDGRRPG